MESLTRDKVYASNLETSVFNTDMIFGNRWIYNFNVDDLNKGRVIVLGWEEIPGVGFGSTFTPVCRPNSIHMILTKEVKTDLECWLLY